LLLLHSGFSTWVEWRPLIEIVAAKREVLAPTLPGSHGASPLELRAGTMLAAHVDHLEALLDRAGWTEPVQVVGSSFGGVAALELAARGRASSVLALGPPRVAAGAGAGFYGALFSATLPWLAVGDRLPARLKANPRVALSLLLHGSLTPVAGTAEDAAAMLRCFGRFPFFRTGIGLGLNGAYSPGMPRAEDITVPVTLAWGAADRIVPGWVRRRWEERLPDAQVEMLVGLPHVPHLRDPERIAALVLRESAHLP